MVLADTATLATLPRRELLAGYAEIAKAGLIADAGLFAWCEANAAAIVGGDRQAQAEAVLRACAFKARVVGDDEREEQVRTTAARCSISATPSATRWRPSSATARSCMAKRVAVGLGLAFRLSARLGLCAEADAGRVVAHMEAVGLPAELAHLNRRISADASDRSHAARQEDARRRAAFRVGRAGSGVPSPRRTCPPRAPSEEMLREEGCEA